jgi:hypothetical protein
MPLARQWSKDELRKYIDVDLAELPHGAKPCSHCAPSAAQAERNPVVRRIPVAVAVGRRGQPRPLHSSAICVRPGKESSRVSWCSW